MSNSKDSKLRLALVFTTVLLIVGADNCFAQNDEKSDKRHFFIDLNYGRGSVNGGEDLKDVITGLFSDVRKENGTSTGSLFVKGGFTQGTRTLLGLTVGFERIPGELIEKSTGDIVGSYRNRYWMIGLEAARIYGKQKSFDSEFYIYGLIGVSYVSRKEEQKELTPPAGYATTLQRKRMAIQVTPIGFSYGKRFRIKGEFGIGYRGVLSMAMSYGLNK